MKPLTFSPLPAGTAGDVSLVRIGSAALRDDPRDCPVAIALKARPRLTATGGRPRLSEPLQGFPLGPLMDALDLIEHQYKPLAHVLERLRHTSGTFGRAGVPPAHPGLVEWTVAAIRNYLAKRESDQKHREAVGAARTYPVPEQWVVLRELRSPDQRGATHYEQTAWGRRYVSLDGTVRELRLLSFSTAKHDRPAAEKAAAAYNAAFGTPCDPAYGRHHRPKPDLPAARLARPERVRVIDVGCGDGSSFVLLDWDLEEVRARYAEHALPVLSRAADGAAPVPGASCVECKAFAACDRPHRTPGMLGLPRPGTPRPRRTVSVSDLRMYAECPAKYHLSRQLKLRSKRPENPAIQRGRAVDAWLNEQHLRRPPNGCRSMPDPPDPCGWSVGDHTVSGDIAEIGARMISQHASLCPLDGLGPREQVRVQPQLSCYDPELDVVVVSTPDLVYTSVGGWIWREVKTATSPLREGRTLMRTYPQLALAVLMIASGVLGGDLRRSRVELELLYPDDCGLEELDPGLPTVVDEARQVISELAAPWQQDVSYDPFPGTRRCADCEVLEWCGPGQNHLAAASS
ncbi:PD-(D/E)XK nuclease family protein [Sphaerisporangium aureirubrum]|uniref:PD-(D/E)XK nuclease family protein n=1 Tax=Sphaerisporangium aureirubrum TaxID=1544736 RepID=A0ABW1NL25_9ACTN